MRALAFTGAASLFFWVLFIVFFMRDRSRYRNCYLLFLALLSLIPVMINLPGEHTFLMLLIGANIIFFSILVVPFFLIHNGIVMIRKEGAHPAHMLSLGLGAVILIGEAAFFTNVLLSPLLYGLEEFQEFTKTPLYAVNWLVSVTVIYGSIAFVIFMIYTLFLQIIPIRRDFDYLIVHGAGLIGGEKISKLLQERLDKAITVYRKDPTPPKIIPSGGKGSDEKLSEAEAMKRYLIEKGIPESDIIMEDRSRTTYENLKYSKEILDSREGRKYTALVTSNYHVYRALRYARETGLKCTGIGSRVAFYYWPSALIREFIAIHAEKKHALIFFAGWAVCMAAVYVTILQI